MSRLLANTSLAERRRGCIFAEDFCNNERVMQNGGAITGAPTINNSVVFDGINNKYIDYTANNPFKNGQPADMTFMFRFTPNQPELASARGLIQGSEANNSFPCITTLNGKMIYYTNSSQFRYSATELVAGQKYHVAVTTDGTIANTKIYIDGKLDNGTAVNSSGSPVPWTFLMLGKRGLLGTTYFDGELEELKIFERQLTPMEIYSDHKQDSEFDDVVYSDLNNSKWSDTANITKEQLPTFQGATDVMKITATGTTGVAINNNPAIATEVGMLYKATLRVWVPSTDGSVAWYWDASADGWPRQTTTLTDQWVDLDIFFIATATTTLFYLKPASIGKSVYVDSLIVSKYNSQECDVDLRFMPEDFDGTSVKNHADATNPFIADGALPTQLKYGGMKFSGTNGLVSTNPLNNKWHQVETYIVAFRKELRGANGYLFANRDTAGGMAVILNETTGNIDNYVGTTSLASLASPYYSINVLIIQRVFNNYYVYNNGIYVGTTTKGGRDIYTGAKKLYLGKRGGDASLTFKGDILRFKHTYGYMNEKNVQKCTYDFLRSIKGGELL